MEVGERSLLTGMSPRAGDGVDRGWKSRFGPMCGCLARAGDGVSAGPTGRRGRGAVKGGESVLPAVPWVVWFFFLRGEGGGLFGTDYRERLGSRSNATGSGVTGARHRRGWINGEYVLEADEWTGNGWAGGLVMTRARGTEGGCGAVDMVVVRCSMTMGRRRSRWWYWIRPCSFLGGGIVVGKERRC